MDKSWDAGCWSQASRRQLYLLRAWEELDLKRQIQCGLLIILLLSVFYFYLTLSTAGTDYLRSILLCYVLILAGGLALWGLVLYEDQKELWNGRFYVRTVTCIGHTEVRTRYENTFCLDILGESGEILEHVHVTQDVMAAIRHQERILAFTKTPEEPLPIRMVPLHLPKKKSLKDILL